MPPLADFNGAPVSWLLLGVRALSFFNTMAALWLGLTVLLNADRRTLATWVAGAGLLLGAAFFAVHSALVATPPAQVDVPLNAWWVASWVLLVVSPYAWYLVVARYTSVQSRLHRGALLGATAFGALAALDVLAAPPLSTMGPPGADPRSTGDMLAELLQALVYPAYSIACIGLSLDALRRTGPSTRFMGDLAVQRARPWLIGATLALLLTGVAVAAAVAWFLLAAGLHRIPEMTGDLFQAGTFRVLLQFDLLISLLVAAALVLMGRATVSYEVFTGKALPRRGLFRHWWRSLVLAGGFGLAAAVGISFEVPAVYLLVAGMVLAAVVFALVSWRSYAERERSIEHLRPFVSSQRLYERLTGGAGEAPGVAGPLAALCDDVLGASMVCLAPLGPLATLVGQPVLHPPAAPRPLPRLDPLFDAPGVLCRPVPPAEYGGAAWAVPLWGARGLVGVLLLGEKRDGGLYTEEEMEVAQAAAQRLIDALATAELSRRLVALQRRRLAEGQLLDQRTRRTLHDDVLPRLQTALLMLNGAAPTEAVDLLTGVHRQIAALLRSLPSTIAPELERRGFVGALQAVVEQELVPGLDAVSWHMEPTAEQALGRLDPLVAEVLFAAAREGVRNAARHGRGDDPKRPLSVTIGARYRNGLELSVADNGEGVREEATPDAGGAGQGLALHSTMLALFGGSLTLEHALAGHTRLVLALPEQALRAAESTPASVEEEVTHAEAR